MAFTPREIVAEGGCKKFTPYHREGTIRMAYKGYKQEISSSIHQGPNLLPIWKIWDLDNPFKSNMTISRHRSKQGS